MSTPPDVSPAQLLFPDLASEIASTRRVLERVPAAQAAWKPHAKSMTLGRLAAHVAELPRFATAVLTADEMDFAKGGYVPLEFESTEQVVAAFDANADHMQALLAGATWEQLGGTWTLRQGDVVFVEGRKGTLLRTLGLSHIVHHRGQLGVYLRQLGIAVPGVYGPSADEM